MPDQLVLTKSRRETYVPAVFLNIKVPRHRNALKKSFGSTRRACRIRDGNRRFLTFTTILSVGGHVREHCSDPVSLL